MARLRLLLAAAMLGTILLVPATANAANPATSYSIPITATAPSGFTITNAAFNLTRFALQNGQLVAIGTLTGTLTNTLTGATTAISQLITIPISVAGTTCQILHLTLGPLDLNLLGLMIHLNQVVLNIDAQSGPGNLLGNLLCAVAGLLDSGGPLTGLVGLLNNILRLLG
jgi:hypothetical protein